MNFLFDDTIRAAAPGYELMAVEAAVVNCPTPDALWREIEEEAAGLRAGLLMERIRHRPAIAATREAYKALGKEPNRYRPSAEALCRRMVKGLELYRSTALVDLINLLSVRSGHSIGGFDADSVAGDTITLSAGREGEPYEAIGRGVMNIAGLPVWRDAVGGIGTPTSDNERTKLSAGTRRLLMTVNIYGPSECGDSDFEALVRRLLTDYASASDISIKRVKP